MHASIPTPTRSISRPNARPNAGSGTRSGTPVPPAAAASASGESGGGGAGSRPAQALARAPRTTGAESADRRFQALKRVDMFTVLTDADIRRISDTLLERHYAPGSAIVYADDPAGGHFFVVAEGEVAVILETQDGKETVLATLQPGEFFGEMSLLDENPRAATARAVGHARLMLLRREDFRRHLRDCPQMAFALLIEMNRRLRQSNRKVAGLSYRSMHARVAGAILGLMEEKGVRQRDESGMRVVIPNRPTQKFLAEMAGTTRESVSRTLAAWGRKGWLRAKGKDLFILEEERIKAFTL
jgi:CRP/FNR family transcriptional regulator, cyclic AMP receptor protein